jgi:hypothetical protein
VGCRSNNDCADKQACSGRECANPCDSNPCSRSDICDVTDHTARCLPSKNFNRLKPNNYYFVNMSSRLFLQLRLQNAQGMALASQVRFLRLINTTINNNNYQYHNPLNNVYN